MKPFLLQAHTVQPPAAPANAVEIPPPAGWGLSGAVLLWLAQRLWETFNRKEQAEEALTLKLIENLEKNQERLLTQLIEVQRQQFESQKAGHETLQELKEAIDNFADTFQQAFEMHDREIRQLQNDVQGLKDRNPKAVR